MATPRNRRVLHTEASLGFGGQEIRILTESRWLLDHGWEVLLACQPDGRLMTEAVAQDVPAVGIPMRSALDVRAIVALRRIMSGRHVDLVHTHSSIDSWLGAAAAKVLGLALVRSRHVSIPIRSGLVYRLADRVITSGETVKAAVTRAGVAPERVIPIPPGLDTSRFHPGVSGLAVRHELGLSGPAVGLLANVRGSKGHRVFLEAARHVLNVGRNVRFIIVGDGVGFEDVRRHVAAMGLERDVTMTGFRRDIPEVIAALDVITLPSIRSEGISQVILQAMAVGTVVVASTVGGSPEVIDHGNNGLLVPPGDSHALAETILLLLGDPVRAKAMAHEAQERVRTLYALDVVMARTTHVYDELLGGPMFLKARSAK